jgi:amino acid adenylation domain-containing protein
MNSLSLHDLFNIQAQRTPQNVAVISASSGERLTYQQLNELSNQMARYLRSLGVNSESLVGICVERSIEMIIAMLAILKAGGAFVPLDPGYPKERIAFMMEDARVEILVSSQRLAENLPKTWKRLVLLDKDWDVIGKERINTLPSRADLDNLAYVIYTSGSTGRPKGVLGINKATLNRFEWMWKTYPFQIGEVCCQKTAISFADSIWEIFGPLLQGVPSVIIPDEISKDVQRLIETLSRYKVTRIVLTPSLLRAILDAQSEMRIDLSDLKIWISSGEALPIDLLKRFQKQIPGGALLNLYGSSEVAADATWFDTSRSENLEFVPIGRPIDAIRVYILDTHLQPVAPGETGEIYVGGVGLARGYINRPDLTAERFLPDPFADEPGMRIYKTGDLARWMPDGNIEFMGRADHQVKIRGFRIELGEIEAALTRHPAVRQAVVLASQDSSDEKDSSNISYEKRLVAYVVPAPGSQMAASDLHRHLHNILPDYMVPSAFVRLEAFPLTPSGKINRLALPAPAKTRPDLDEEFVPPHTPQEALMAELWEHLLGLDRVGVNDNFFELGGHSLLAARLIMQIRQRLQIDLPLNSLFDMPTVAALTAGIAGLPRSANHAALEMIPQVDRTTPLPLSFSQQRLWFLDQLMPNTVIYNETVTFRLTGNLDPIALERSLVEIIRRHEVLRTTFTSSLGRAHQVIHSAEDFRLSVVDLSDVNAEQEQIARLNRMSSEEADTPFHLESGPLFRARLLQLNKAEHVLLICVHHIVWDDWSLGVFMQELSALYRIYAIGAESTLKPLPIQYADFAAWQRNWLQGTYFENLLSYWKQNLSGELPVLALPTDHPRPPVQTYHGAAHTFLLPNSLLEALKTMGRQQDATLFMTLLAAFNVLLHRYSGQTDILLGAPVANRMRPETEALIGFFVNTLVLRIDLSGDPTFQELIRRARTTALDAYAHQDLPFEALVDALQIERDLSRQPLFQVMIALQNARPEDMSLPGLNLRPLEVTGKTAKFDLTLFLAETRQGLAATFEYNTDLFDESTILRLAGHFQVLLLGIAAHPEGKISELPLLTETEQRQLLVEWNNTAVTYTPDCFVPQMFEAQAERTPEAIAVIFEEQKMTYRELNERANQLASCLQKLGVGPEVLVGICVERSPEMLVGLLAILKAGGAYMPLDPSYPSERLNFMLEDTGISLLLTQKRLTNSLPTQNIRMICLDTDWAEIVQVSAAISEKTPVKLRGDNLAYVIYTSGSTGKPKGAMLTHQGLANYLNWSIAAYKVEQGEGSPVHSSLGFDLTITSLFPALLSGKSVELLPETPGIEGLSAVLREAQGSAYSLVKITPAHLNALNQELSSAEKLRKVHRFIIGGEALQGESLLFWGSRLPETRFVNEYGPTETVVGCCTYEISGAELATGMLPIGKPIANTQLYILDAHLQPVPVGVAGELYIGGAGVARGYLNRPELTAERFIPDPFSSRAGARLYRTGDMARYLPGGNLDFLGRADTQVKIRGYRIELGEIESQLRQFPGIQEVSVIVWQEAQGDKRLAAYFTSEADVDISAAALLNFLRQSLPDYMMPSAFIRLESMPLTPNGKVDRKGLPAPSISRLKSKSYAPPRDSFESLLSSIWEETLNVHPVGIHDNFFELGGDSILGMQIIAKARLVNIYLTPMQIFQHQTVAQLAAAALQAAESGQILQAQQNPISGSAQPTPMQRRLFENPNPTNPPDRYTPADFPDTGLSQQELDDLLNELDDLPE